jgi:hypothetical protein
MTMQKLFYEDIEYNQFGKCYNKLLTVSENRKGVLDVDTVKGCKLGIEAYPNGGCYGECYAYKNANRYGLNFSISSSRILNRYNMENIFLAVKNHSATWYRIGVSGDPCHDWENTIFVCEFLYNTGKIPVIITKHWIALSNKQLFRLEKLFAVINTSTSGMDTDNEIKYRVEQIKRIKNFSIRSINRIVTCKYGKSVWAKRAQKKQDYLLSLKPIIDNPFRVGKSNVLVLNKDIFITKRQDSVGGGKFISLHDENVYLGKCKECIDQCGVNKSLLNERKYNGKNKQAEPIF